MAYDKYEFENLMDEVDKLLKAQDALTCAQIDAANTRSRIDYRTKEEKENRLHELKTKFEEKLKAALSK